MQSQPRVVIIGAGVGGLSLAIALKSRFGFRNFTAGIGPLLPEKISLTVHPRYMKRRTKPIPTLAALPTWRYTGIAYHLTSTPTGTNHTVSNPKFKTIGLVLQRNMDCIPHLVFDTKVISAEWNDDQSSYTIIAEEVLTGKRITDTAQIVISAVGVLETPRIPYEIPGIETFKGISFHSAAWPRGLDLRRKHVAVIGNASSGAQFVPYLAADPSVYVVNFIRTPVWFNTRPHIPYSDTAKWVFANIPFVMRLHRAYIMYKFDSPSLWPQSAAARERHRRALRQYILDSTPSKYHDDLIPTHPPGCKRTGGQP
ncbi:hypothetical protein JVT61DRAFT_1092 [Boletus reticuloceps]|uniref:Monooxygenase n=1 Tax=Boletus reticuloceps TaxID=495285 RepID=A0A8I3AB83_9AGAM|nr:hypothetical protein JVT61DRAFT_1092 [Boletus reticuloceps]